MVCFGSLTHFFSRSNEIFSQSIIGLAINSCTQTAVPIIAKRNCTILCWISPGTNVTNAWYATHAITAKTIRSTLVDTRYLFCMALIRAEIVAHTIVVMSISICVGWVKLVFDGVFYVFDVRFYFAYCIYVECKSLF